MAHATEMTPATDDPRVRRTRILLLDALCELMHAKDFERISVADIAEVAQVNRATFYAHFADKFALLDGLVTARFDAMLESRGIIFSGCPQVLRATILAACDFLEAQPYAQGSERAAPPPQLEAATIAVIRRRLLAGMRSRATSDIEDCGRAELIASTAAWAMYGAVREWLAWPTRVPAVDVVDTIRSLVQPILATAPWLDIEGAPMQSTALEVGA